MAIVVDEIPLDALAARLGLRRNAIYKEILDARRKIRRAHNLYGTCRPEPRWR